MNNKRPYHSCVAHFRPMVGINDHLPYTTRWDFDTHGMTLLGVASFAGDVELMRSLVVDGADPNLADSNGRTALHDAAVSSHPGAVRYLLDLGVAVDIYDSDHCTPLHYTPLHRAPASIDVLRLLVSRRADVNAPDGENYTPLHQVAANGTVEYVRVLIEAGANVDALTGKSFPTDADTTAAMMAARAGNFAVLRLLVRSGARLDQRDDDGDTVATLAARFRARNLDPLQAACARRAGYEDVASRLRDGWDPRARSEAGETAFDLATRSEPWLGARPVDPGTVRAVAEAMRPWIPERHRTFPTHMAPTVVAVASVVRRVVGTTHRTMLAGIVGFLGRGAPRVQAAPPDPPPCPILAAYLASRRRRNNN